MYEWYIERLQIFETIESALALCSFLYIAFGAVNLGRSIGRHPLGATIGTLLLVSAFVWGGWL